MDQDRDRKKRSRELVNLFKSTNIVVSFSTIVIANIAVGGFLGYYIDKWTFNNRIIFILLLFLGIISGIYNGIKYLLKEVEKLDGKSKKN